MSHYLDNLALTLKGQIDLPVKHPAAIDIHTAIIIELVFERQGSDFAFFWTYDDTYPFAGLGGFDFVACRL